MFSILNLLLVQQSIRSSIASPDIGLNVFMAITNTSDPEDKTHRTLRTKRKPELIYNVYRWTEITQDKKLHYVFDFKITIGAAKD